MSAVPLLDLEAHHRPLIDELRTAIDRVLVSNHFILGPEVEALEREMAAYVGVPHAMGVSSGTDAILVALMALGLGPGDEVVTTPFTFFATAGCPVRLGCKPVFVDIDPVTFNIDVSKLEAAITSRTKAILPVHLFGQPCDMETIRTIADKRGIAVIEDAAQSIGAKSNAGPTGAVGAYGCFSFFPSKNLGGLGDGGLVTTRDDDRAKLIRSLRAHGAEPKYFHARVGGNFRLDAIQGAALRVKLPHLDGWTAARRANAARYDVLFAEANLPEGLIVTPKRIVPGHVYNQYVIRTPRRDALQAHLKTRGIGSEVYYPLPLHLQQCFLDLGYKLGAFPEAERAAKEVLALPIFPELGEDRLRRVVDEVVAFFAAA